MRITIAQQNLRSGGWGKLDPAGPRDPDYDRLPELVDRIGEADADVIVLNEVRDWRTYDRGEPRPTDPFHVPPGERERLVNMADRLGLVLADITPSASGIPSAILYRPDTLGPAAWHAEHHYLTDNGYGIAEFKPTGLAQPFAVCALHANAWSSQRARMELQAAASLICEFNNWGAIVGDLNSPPAYGPPANVARMRPHHRANRLANPNGPGTPEPNLETARALADAGFIDVAEALHACEAEEAETAVEVLERVRTGKTDRIDRIHVTGHLGATPVSYRRLERHQYASDHFGIACTLDLSHALETDPSQTPTGAAGDDHAADEEQQC